MRELLSPEERQRLDPGDDARFYDRPRFVHHVDEGFRDRLTDLYAESLEVGDVVLDLMGSWVAHLPDRSFERVVGHGLNAEELRANGRYDEWFVRDLNATPGLDLPDASFDTVTCAVSVQYLQYPGTVFAEVGRVLRPGGVCIVSFSNRMFLRKAVRGWRERDMDGRAELVSRYFESMDVFGAPTVVREFPERDPFYAAVARRPK
jgi:SAM-dependent methyltransferase